MSEYTSADAIKSMKLFFIDNQGAWPAHKDGTSKAELVGDLVVWPDDGRYPNYVPVACATHPNFKGVVIVQAGTRGLLVSLVEGATPEDDLKARFKSMEGIQQFRVSIDAIVHRIVMWLAAGSADGTSGIGTPETEVDPLSLMAWMAASDKGRGAARVVAAALSNIMGGEVGNNLSTLKSLTEDLQKTDPKADAFTICDGLLTTIQQSIAARGAQTAAAPVKRR